MLLQEMIPSNSYVSSFNLMRSARCREKEKKGEPSPFGFSSADEEL